MASYICKDDSGQEPITGFSIDAINVKRDSDVIAAPVESGQQSFDNKVIKPMEIVVNGSIYREDATGALSSILEMYASRKFKFYSVQDGDDLYPNLILKSCPLTRNTEKIDLNMVELVFVEAMLIQEQRYTPANPEDRSDVKSGNVKPKQYTGNGVLINPR